MAEFEGVNMTGRTVTYRYGVDHKYSADTVLDWMESGAVFTCLYYEDTDEIGHK